MLTLKFFISSPTHSFCRSCAALYSLQHYNNRCFCCHRHHQQPLRHRHCYDHLLFVNNHVNNHRHSLQSLSHEPLLPQGGGMSPLPSDKGDHVRGERLSFHNSSWLLSCLVISVRSGTSAVFCRLWDIMALTIPSLQHIPYCRPPTPLRTQSPNPPITHFQFRRFYL